MGSEVGNVVLECTMPEVDRSQKATYVLSCLLEDDIREARAVHDLVGILLQTIERQQQKTPQKRGRIVHLVNDAATKKAIATAV
jgi:hypothetical protein